MITQDHVIENLRLFIADIEAYLKKEAHMSEDEETTGTSPSDSEFENNKNSEASGVQETTVTTEETTVEAPNVTDPREEKRVDETVQATTTTTTETVQEDADNG